MNQEYTKSFTQWCKQKDTLPTHTKNIVEVLLQLAGTTDCAIAEQELNKQNYLNLSLAEIDWIEISELSSLAELTNLIELYLWENQITNLLPITQLTN